MATNYRRCFSAAAILSTSFFFCIGGTFARDHSYSRSAVSGNDPEFRDLGKADIAAAGRALNLPLPQASAKIIGGVEAAEKEFPFIVSLRAAQGHFCGGSLIKKNWVLTAGHCAFVNSFAKDGLVVIGARDLRQTDGIEVFHPEKVIRHPGYRGNPPDYDFALIRLDGDSKFAPIALNREELNGDRDLVTAGWGKTTEDPWSTSGLSKVLMKVTVPLVSVERCSKAYPKEITDRMICAGFDEGGRDHCYGDSGGPLILGTGPDGVLAGVVSWANGCARPKQYGVSGKVSSVISWIEDTIK